MTFWDETEKLKPNVKHHIPLDVYDDKGNDVEYVIGIWKREVSVLYYAEESIIIFFFVWICQN